jgi:serralysin
MLRRRVLAVLACLGAVSGAALVPGPAEGKGTPPDGEGTAGPPYDYETALMGEYALIPLPDQAMITRTEHGYLFRAGQQDTHLVVTVTGGRLRFDDAGTERFKKLARACREEAVPTGVAATCRLPRGISTAQPLLLEVWPRLGNDFVDGSGLPNTFAMTVLSDAGHDTALLGAGPDFFNGFTGRDRVSGGAGNDWIRTGDGADVVWGGAGDDQLVGTDGNDRFYGDDGDDRLGGGAGSDRLDGGLGNDNVFCETGVDSVWTDGLDRLLACESVSHT